MKTLAATLIALSMLAVPAIVRAQSADIYDAKWYRAEFWSGEYPDGFTVVTDTHLKLRPTLDPKAEKSIDCEVAAKATYHQWNNVRVQSDGLAFVGFTRIDERKVTKDIDVTLYAEADSTEVPTHFKAGDTFRYLTYYGEGAFLMEKDGVKYQGDQDLAEASTSSFGDTTPASDEWLRLNCRNNVWGWLFMGDTANDPALTGANIVGYGESADAE